MTEEQRLTESREEPNRERVSPGVLHDFHQSLHSFLLKPGIGSGMAEDAALVVLVIQFRAERASAMTSPQKNLGRAQHSQRRRNKIYPQRMPVTASHRRAEGARRIRAHAG